MTMTNILDRISNGMPVRKILPNARSVTGNVPDFGAYESTLERDMMEILRFDPQVEHFQPQPLTILFHDKNGKKRQYTPDGLVHFKNGSKLGLLPILYEVKFREDFRKNWRELMPKFRAAKEYCRNYGYRFEVFTETDIRTPYLHNARFLWEYVSRKPSPAIAAHVLNILADLEEANPNFLLCALCSDKMNRAQYIPVIWHLVAIGAISCDLDQPLTMRSTLTNSVASDE